MREISANPSHRVHRHMWGEGGFPMQAWLPSSHTFPRQLIKAPNHSCTRRDEGVGDTVWQAELVAIPLTNGGLIWHRATQSNSWDSNMHIRSMLTECVQKQFPSQRHATTHKAVPRAHIAGTGSICEVVTWLYKQAQDPICSEGCSLKSVNL